MPWSRPTVTTIYERIVTGIESRLTGGVALLRRSVLRILSKVFAGEIHLNYGYIEFISKQLFPDTAETEWLAADLKATARRVIVFAHQRLDQFAGAGHQSLVARALVLAPRVRGELAPLIQERALAWHVAWADVEEIDSLNILGATMLAMRRAVEGLAKGGMMMFPLGLMSVVMVMVPCSGMASRAFMTRFIKTCSSWWRSR